MAKIICPHCKNQFSLDDIETDSIVRQIRDAEFEKALNERLFELTKNLEDKHELEMEKVRSELTRKLEEDAQKKQDELNEKLQKDREDIAKLKAELEGADREKELAVLKAVKGSEDNIRSLEKDIKSQKERYEILLDEKEKQVELYKDMKIRMSTKMVGESLENHCKTEFDKLRATAFKNAYFEKDNDARTGSKGDFIYREDDGDGTPVISIMFEMKNETDTTSTKHKNEDFFKELDKDRKEKNCEYAVLVSMLESDNEYYNAGIVDVSYAYDKMYVVRPQCFIPIITILRNAAFNSLSYRQEIRELKEQNIDISDFEEKLIGFKDDFGRNYKIAHDHFDKAIDEIDKTIQHLEKVKKELMGSDNQLRIANNKVEDVSIKKLVGNNPTMAEKFRELKK